MVKLTTDKVKLLPPDENRKYWIAQDAPFQGFGLTPEEAIADLEQRIKKEFKSPIQGPITKW